MTVNDSPAAQVLKALCMGVKVKIGETHYALIKNVDGESIIKSNCNGSIHPWPKCNEMPEFLKLCDTATDDELAIISCNVVLNKTRQTKRRKLN